MIMGLLAIRANLFLGRLFILTLLGIIGFTLTSKAQFLKDDIRLKGYQYELQQFDKQEIRFKVPKWRSLNLNQYDPDQVDVWVTFESPKGKRKQINAFYYEDYYFADSPDNPCDYAYLKKKKQARKVAKSRYEAYRLKKGAAEWRVRFRPQQLGEWRFRIHAKIKSTRLNQTYYYQFPKTTNLKEGLTFKVRSKQEFSGYIEVNQQNSGKQTPFYLRHKASKDLIIPNGENIPSDRSGWLNQHLLTRKNQKNPFNSGPCGAEYKGRIYGSDKRMRAIGGLCQYKGYIDELVENNANYFRFSINGEAHPDHSNHFLYYNPYKADFGKDSSGALAYNLKNAWRYDKIFQYADKKGIYLKFSILQFYIFKKDWDSWNPWNKEVRAGFYNNPCQFFRRNTRGFEELKNMVRYMVARWGHASNIISWEIMDEMANIKQIPGKGPSLSCFEASDSIKAWYQSLARYIKDVDHGRHPVSPGAFNVYKFYDQGNQKDSIITDIAQLKSLDFLEINQGYLGDIKNKCNCQIISDFSSKTCLKGSDYCVNLRANPPEEDTEKVSFANSLRLKTRWETSRFFKYPLRMRKELDKGVMINSFWFNISDHAYTKSEIDNPSVYHHNVLWRGLFSGSLGPSVAWSTNHPRYEKKNAVWNGADKFDYMGYKQYDLPWYSDKVRFNEGGLGVFKGIQNFIQYINFNRELKTVSNTMDKRPYLNGSQIGVDSMPFHLFGFKVLDNKPGEPKFYGYVQDTAFYYASLFKTSVDYLAGEPDGDTTIPSTNGCTIQIRDKEAQSYRIHYFDPVSGARKASKKVCKNVNEQFMAPTPEPNPKYGDLAFIAEPDPKPKLSMNGDKASNTVRLNDRMTLAGSRLYRCDTIQYKVSIKPLNNAVDSNIYGDQFQSHQKPVREVNLKRLCEDVGLTLKPGNRYKLQLTVPKPRKSSHLIFKIAEEKG